MEETEEPTGKYFTLLLLLQYDFMWLLWMQSVEEIIPKLTEGKPWFVYSAKLRKQLQYDMYTVVCIQVNTEGYTCTLRDCVLIWGKLFLQHKLGKSIWIQSLICITHIKKINKLVSADISVKFICLCSKVKRNAEVYN
jgi:hypothetical protein